MAEQVERPEDLYGVDLGDFVRERNALAARLKADGERDAAAEVRGLTKPTRSAWALNALARAEPAVVEQVLSAAQQVTAAISDGGDELRSAQGDYTRAVSEAVDAAAQRSGVSGDAPLERMRATLLAAGADPGGEVAADLRAGTLAADARAPGFTFAGVPPVGVDPDPATDTVEDVEDVEEIEDADAGEDETAREAARAAADHARDELQAARQQLEELDSSDG